MKVKLIGGFQKRLKSGGQEVEPTLHDAHHTFAKWLMQERVSIYEVLKLPGHSDISVTQVYTHLGASELHGAVNKISISLN